MHLTETVGDGVPSALTPVGGRDPPQSEREEVLPSPPPPPLVGLPPPAVGLAGAALPSAGAELAGEELPSLPEDGALGAISRSPPAEDELGDSLPELGDSLPAGAEEG